MLIAYVPAAMRQAPRRDTLVPAVQTLVDIGQSGRLLPTAAKSRYYRLVPFLAGLRSEAVDASQHLPRNPERRPELFCSFFHCDQSPNGAREAIAGKIRHVTSR